MTDVIVIGGGVVGASVAYHLVGLGAKTLLIDRQDPGRATNAGAGILSPQTSAYESPAWFNFAIEAVLYYDILLEQLQQAQVGDTGYAVCGLLNVAVSEDEIAPFEQTKQMIFDRQQQRGVPSAADLFEISAREARDLFPALTVVQKALYYRNAARVDGRLLAQALIRAAQQQGLLVEQGGVERLMIGQGGVNGIVANSQTFSADNVVIAGGAWSPSFGRQLGLTIPLEPQRGQIIHLNLPQTDTSAWPIINAFREHYIVAWPEGRIAVGATRETGSGFVPQATAAGLHEVTGEALRVAPGLAQAHFVEVRVGLRPLTRDTLPVLGAVPGIDNVYLATGHGPTGLQLGPYSGKLIADLISGQSPATDISAFSISRFS